MHVPSRHILSFPIAGFQHWDGALVINELEVGQSLDLVPERDNPHDPCAIAIYHHGTKLGFVPARDNSLISMLMYFGHENVLECRIQQVDARLKPWEQVRVGIFVTDARQDL